MKKNRNTGSILKRSFDYSAGDAEIRGIADQRGDEPIHGAASSASEDDSQSSVGGGGDANDDEDDDLPWTHERKHSGGTSKHLYVDSTDESEKSHAESGRGDKPVQETFERKRTSVQTKKRPRLTHHPLYRPDDSGDSDSSFESSDAGVTRVARSEGVGARGRSSKDAPLALDPAEQKSWSRRVIPLRLAARRAQKAKWTECVAAAHIVQDEVNRCLQEELVSLTSREVIAEWTGLVTKALVAQNTRVIDNVEAVAAAKTSQNRVDTLRNEVLRLKNHVRISLRDHEHLQEQIENERQHNASCRAATRFLKKIDQLRK